MNSVTSEKLKNNPYYVPSDEQQEEMNRLRDLEEPQSVMPENNNFEDNSFSIHNDSLPVHEVKIGKKKKNKKYENNQELNQN